MKIHYLARAVFAASLIMTSLSAADDDRGRLSDGRAYRTDSQGNQLVDYIAELELSNDSLRRQVAGLESEVEQKQALIDKIGRTGSDAPVVERTLIGEAAPRAECKETPCDCASKIQERVSEVEHRAQQNEKEFLRRINALQVGRSEELAQAQRIIEQLREDSVQKEVLLKSYEDGVRSAANEKGRLEGALTQKHQEIAELRTEASTLDGETRDLRARIDQLQAERESLSSQEAAIQKVIGERRRAVTEAQAAAASIETPPVPTAPEVREVGLRGELRERREGSGIREAAIEPEPLPAEQSATRASFSIARESALDALRGKLSTSLNQIQGRVSSRDRLYAEYMKGPQVVAFRPADARSSKGRSIAQIKGAIQDAQTARELSLITREVNEIRSKVEFDIGMMERVKRLR